MYDGFSSHKLTYHEIMKRDKFLWQHGSHPEWTLFIMEEGIFTLEMNGAKKTVAANDLVFFPPNMTFRRKIIMPVRFHFMQFLQSVDKSALPIPVGKVALSDKARIIGDSAALTAISYSPDKRSPLLCQHIFNDILFRCYYESLYPENRVGSGSDEVIREALDYLKSNLRHKITLNDMAKKIGITPAGLIGKFKHEFGVTPIEYLTHLKISRAKELLLNTGLSVTEISDICGFQNCYYFSSTFKKHTGLPPSQYRIKFRV